MKTLLLLASTLFYGMTTVSTERPELLSVSTQTSHRTLAKAISPNRNRDTIFLFADL